MSFGFLERRQTHFYLSPHGSVAVTLSFHSTQPASVATHIRPRPKPFRQLLRHDIVHWVCRMQAVQPEVLINWDATGLIERRPLWSPAALDISRLVPADERTEAQQQLTSDTHRSMR